MSSVTRLFENREQALEAVAELKRNEFSAESITVIGPAEGQGAPSEASARADDATLTSIMRAGVPRASAEAYADGVRRGGTVVSVRPRFRLCVSRDGNPRPVQLDLSRRSERPQCRRFGRPPGARPGGAAILGRGLAGAVPQPDAALLVVGLAHVVAAADAVDHAFGRTGPALPARWPGRAVGQGRAAVERGRPEGVVGSSDRRRARS